MDADRHRFFPGQRRSRFDTTAVRGREETMGRLTINESRKKHVYLNASADAAGSCR